MVATRSVAVSGVSGAERPWGCPAERDDIERTVSGSLDGRTDVRKLPVCAGGCVGSGVMKLVVQVKLLPTPVQAAELEATLHACNEAATWVSGVAFVKDVKRNFALREHTYSEIKQRWGLGAQAAQHAIKKTCDAYRTLAANLKAGNLGKPWSKRYRRAVEKPITFRPEGAQPYDDRMLSWQIADRTVSLWTLSGRMKQVAFMASPEQLARLALYRKGESDLVARDGMWFLQATCEIPEAPLHPAAGHGVLTPRRTAGHAVEGPASRQGQRDR
ncbi:hypothetical protein [Streptomyces sp. B21-105]|uniref:hypothetical protein n=1 Tax=Streptomyces sp. B21-105 TaxID=3039417 RepID=UPI003FA6F16D